MEGLLRQDADETDLRVLRKQLNLCSIRLTLDYGVNRALLPGDCYGFYFEDEPVGKVDLLKMPHHGCPASMTEKLIQKLRPEVLVVSVSNDRAADQRPCKRVLDVCAPCCASIWFTDAVGYQAPQSAPCAAQCDGTPRNHLAIRCQMDGRGPVHLSEVNEATVNPS